MTSFWVGDLETGMFHIRSGQLMGHQTVTSVSEQHFPQTSAVIPFSLSSADKGPVCFFKSFHFPLFFISLPNLSLFFSPTLPGSLNLLRATFPPFFFIFWLFPLGVIESPNDLFSLFLWFLSLACFYEPSALTLLVTTQALWSLFVLLTLSHIFEHLEEGQEKKRNFLRHINIYFGEKSLISL